MKRLSQNKMIGAYALSLGAGMINGATIYAVSISSTHVTGALTRMAMGAALPQWDMFAGVWYACLAFFIGSIGSTFFKKQYRSIGWIACVVSVGCLVGYVLRWDMYMVFSFLMGLQNGLHFTIQGVTVRTTHFTGYLTDLGRIVGKWLHGKPVLKEQGLLFAGSIGFFVLGAYSIIRLYVVYSVFAMLVIALVYGVISVYFLHLFKEE